MLAEIPWTPTTEQVENRGRCETTTIRSGRTTDNSGGRDADPRRRQGVEARQGARVTHTLDKDAGCGYVMVQRCCLGICRSTANPDLISTGYVSIRGFEVVSEESSIL